MAPTAPLTSIHYARLDWQSHTPVAQDFDDVYFMKDKGLDEARYVFLEGNDLPRRWQSHKVFVIGETGFGTGLNFLATWQQWQRYKPVGGRLHYLALECDPLSAADLRRALSYWPELQPLSEQLIAQYPLAFPGAHRCHFNDVTLTLWWGDAQRQLTELIGQVDAWYLDGFAPSKNPQMWSPALFRELARHAKPGTTLATFTAAGQVRRDLTAIGFEVTKRPGFAHKREMLSAVYRGRSATPSLPPRYQLPAPAKPESVAVIGGGLAGCATAQALAWRGISVNLFESESQLAQGASGNPLSLIHGKLSANLNSVDALLTPGALYTQRLIPPGVFYQQSGMVHLAAIPRLAQRFSGIMARGLMPDCVRAITAAEASELCGIEVSAGGIWLPWVGYCQPAALCRQWAMHPGIQVHGNTAIASINQCDMRWQLQDQAGNHYLFDQVVIANSFAAKQFVHSQHLPIFQSPGQLTLAPATQHSQALRCILDAAAYLTPAVNGQHVLGATYRHDGNTALTQADHAKNFSQLAQVSPTLAQDLQQQIYQGRVACRATTIDHLPIVGALPDYAWMQQHYAVLRHGKSANQYAPVQYLSGLWVNLAHGSKALASAALCAENIACQMLGEPLPVSLATYQAIHPARFWVRALKRQ